MRSILIILLLGLLAAFSGCVAPESGPQVKKTVVSEPWKPDGVIGADEYSRSMLLQGPKSQGYSGGDLEISWKNDAEFLYLALNGSTMGWIALGFEPSEWMKDADIILASVHDGKAAVLDEYCTGNYGPHQNDTELGGTYDILELGGRAKGARTIIELKRRMNTGDRFDSAFVPGQRISMIWGMADAGSNAVKHNVAKGEGIMALEEGVQKEAAPTALTVREEEGLLFIWEEEKVARDLYLQFYDGASQNIFQDISRSEQNHMDAVKVLIDKYRLDHPMRGDGLFANQTLQGIYDQLLAQGRRSEDDALTAAATFEEISMLDLEKEMASTDKDDIRTVYQGLLAGSEKHLRSYVNALRERGIRYAPQHLRQEDFDRIGKTG